MYNTLVKQTWKTIKVDNFWSQNLQYLWLQEYEKYICGKLENDSFGVAGIKVEYFEQIQFKVLKFLNIVHEWSVPSGIELLSPDGIVTL